MEMKLGTHLILDAWDCPKDWLDDVSRVEKAIKWATKEGRATLIQMVSHQFSPQGVTATATLAESHIAVHTWPEHGYFAADIFFCGNLNPYLSILPLVEALGAKRHRVREVIRGMPARVPEEALITEQIG